MINRRNIQYSTLQERKDSSCVSLTRPPLTLALSPGEREQREDVYNCLNVRLYAADLRKKRKNIQHSTFNVEHPEMEIFPPHSDIQRGKGSQAANGIKQ